MATNGVNGTSAFRDLPSGGLWLVVVDGGVGYLARTIGERTEDEVRAELESTGQVSLHLQPVYVLDCVRGAVQDANRGMAPIALPIAQRIDQRIGLPDDFPLHITATAVVFLSEMTPETRTQVQRVIENVEKTIVEARAKRSGLTIAGSMPTR